MQYFMSWLFFSENAFFIPK